MEGPYDTSIHNATTTVQGGTMIKFKHALAAAALLVSTFTLVTSPANAASCSQQSPTRASFKTRNFSWDRFNDNGTVVGVGYASVDIMQLYMDCGDKHTKIYPTSARICLNDLNVSGDPLFTGSVGVSMEVTNDYNLNSYADAAYVSNSTVCDWAHYTSSNWYAVGSNPTFEMSPLINSTNGYSYTKKTFTVNASKDPIAPLF